MDKARFRLLVVDEDRGLCAAIQDALRREGYLVEAAHEGAVALELLRTQVYHLVIADVRLPSLAGLQLLQQARAVQRDTQLIVTTAQPTAEGAAEAMKAGAYDYAAKPLDLQRLRVLVAKALELQSVVAENNELRRRLRQKTEPSLLVGESEPIRRVLRLAQEVARSDVAVLIEGESGTGKELVARTIHQYSPRAAKPFVAVNCAALAEPLLESELFGQAKGTFAGGARAKLGRMQLADGGTLFFDEITNLPAKAQADLLHFLEEGAFRMAGGTELVRANVRIVAAAHARLQDAVSSGRFREDLYSRLQFVPIAVPPLRERGEDIPLLIDSFLDYFSARHKRRRKTLATEAMEVCRRFPWPGNVRQLRNAIERLVVTCAEPTIGVDDLPEFLHAQDRSLSGCEIRPGMTISECEKLLIRQTITHATSNREQAARLLGISRRTLQYKLKSYGLLAVKRDSVLAPPLHPATN